MIIVSHGGSIIPDMLNKNKDKNILFIVLVCLEYRWLWHGNYVGVMLEPTFHGLGWKVLFLCLKYYLVFLLM